MNKLLKIAAISLGLLSANAHATNYSITFDPAWSPVINALIGDYLATGSNFTMLSPKNMSGDCPIFDPGGATYAQDDVTGTLDDTKFCSDIACTDVAVIMGSDSPFSGSFWSAHDVRVFTEGTYQVETCPFPRIDSGGLAGIIGADGSTLCPDLTTPSEITLTVGPGQLGAHILFDWGSIPTKPTPGQPVLTAANRNIDVALLWDINAPFTRPGPQAALAFIPDNTRIYTLASRDVDGNGCSGAAMVDGPFNGHHANFSLFLDPAFQLNVAPVANDDGSPTAIDVAHLGSVDINVLANDTDVNTGPGGGSDLDPSTVTVTSGPAQGMTSVNMTTGVITYTPDTTYAGPDSFTYTVKDLNGGLTSNTATVSVNVTNAPPTATGAAAGALVGSIVNIDLTAKVSDPEGAIDLTSILISTPPAEGTCVPHATLPGWVTYTANLVQGVYHCFYTVADDLGLRSAPADITITVAANPGPAAGGSSATIPKGASVDFDVNLLASDPDGLDLATILTTNPPNGQTSVNTTTGIITYTADAGFAGTDSFTYTVEDNLGAVSNPGLITITVTNQAPVASDISGITTVTGTGVDIDVSASASDPDGNIIVTSVLATNGVHGTTSVNPTTGIVTYLPVAGFAGSDSFTYTVEDDNGLISNSATVTITVQATAPSTSIGTLNPGTIGATGGTMDGAGLIPADVSVDGEMSQQCIGGCFDFEVSGIQTGSLVEVVLPLSAPIPNDTSIVYRKLINNVWVNLDNVDGSGTATAPALAAGPVCPPPTDGSWVIGLNANHECLRLTLKEGGVNDADVTPDTTLVDPGGLGIPIVQVFGPPATSLGSGSGCSVTNNPVTPQERGDLWLLLSFVVLLGWYRRKNTQHL